MNLTIVPFQSETLTSCVSRTNPRSSQIGRCIDVSPHNALAQDTPAAGEIVIFLKFELRSRAKLHRISLE